MPVIGFEALRYIFGKAQIRGAVERDQVVVIQHDQLAQLQRAGQRAALVGDALHQVAIPADHVCVVIDDLGLACVVDRLQVLLGDG